MSFFFFTVVHRCKCPVCLLDDSPKGVYSTLLWWIVLCSSLYSVSLNFYSSTAGRKLNFFSSWSERLYNWDKRLSKCMPCTWQVVKSLFTSFHFSLILLTLCIKALIFIVGLSFVLPLSMCEGGSTVIHLVRERERVCVCVCEWKLELERKRGVASGPASGKMSTPQPEKTNKRSYLCLCTRHTHTVGCFVPLRFISCVSVTLSLFV